MDIDYVNVDDFNPNIEEQTDELRLFFSDAARFEFEGRVGNGAFGFGCLFRERLADGSRQRFVVKRAFSRDDQILNEIKQLTLLQHAEHVVDLVKVHPDPLEPDEYGVGGLGSAYVILEYLEGGTVMSFTVRCMFQPVPNRIITNIFLCLVKACVALAFPPEGPDDGSETIPPMEEPSTLYHWDMNTGNVMFGSLDPRRREHALVPVVKLIDFGLAGSKTNVEVPSMHYLTTFDNVLELWKYRVEGVTNPAIQANIFDIGLLLVMLIGNVSYEGVSWCRNSLLNPQMFPELDPNVRHLLSRCLAADPVNRPKLDELLERVQDLVDEQDDMWYTHAPGRVGEKDEDIYNFVQRYVYDAPVQWRPRPSPAVAGYGSGWDGEDELSDGWV